VSNLPNYLLLCQRGLESQQAGRLDEARKCYEAALRIAPPSPELSHNLGMVCRQLGDLPKARESLERALALRPDALPTLDELAQVCQESGDLDAALTCYEKALRIDPRHSRAFAGMGIAFTDAGWEDDAVRAFETALAIEPDQLEATNGLGILYKRQGRFDLALARFDHALALSPDDTGLQRNRAMILGALGRFDEEEAVYREILARDPTDADAHFGLACVLLLTGRLPEGWREYEWRFVSRQSGEAIRRPASGLPRWAGEAVARESSGLVIYAEQGFGDGIQFSRFVPLVAERFGRVRLHTRKPLLRLFERSFGALAEVVAEDRNKRDESGFTHHCPLLSLPLALGTTLETIPASSPYLRADAEKSRRWRERLASKELKGRLKIGVAWATGKRGVHKRSFELGLSLLEPMWSGIDACWVSLNKEPLDPSQAAVLQRADVVDWSGELDDFDDTAALIEALDLVISVDTATAHLAGALARPVWLLNRAESEWRWLLGRDDSPWYPTMRIFRQRQSRQWEPVLQDVAEALRAMIGGESEHE
jgi:tetratricopeptide (TPR) repeat protein